MSCFEHKSNTDMEPRVPLKTPVDRRNGKHVKANDIPPEGVYLPNNNFMAPHMQSPEYVQLSNAAAITLGIMGGRMYGCECTRCLNLLLTYPEGCRANCAYCGLARHREADRDYADRNFIRVDWPAVPMAEIIDDRIDGAVVAVHAVQIKLEQGFARDLASLHERREIGCARKGDVVECVGSSRGFAHASLSRFGAGMRSGVPRTVTPNGRRINIESGGP